MMTPIEPEPTQDRSQPQTPDGDSESPIVAADQQEQVELDNAREAYYACDYDGDWWGAKLHSAF
ncbi:MAG: hypothetical protein KDD53_11235 [Bdellovibrionales bacterium]|nr:hypothetical protein [Bdellovibrionales bacterium]